MLTLRKATIAKVNNIIKAIDVLLATDFPYEGPQAALERIHQHFEERLEALKGLDEGTHPFVERQLCSESLDSIAIFLPILGFTLRATSMRNAFELHGPLLRLAQKGIQADIKLLLSSEWDFSPFTYILTDLPPLSGFVLIGLPASESDNALVAPLSGHEFGHSIWIREGMRNELGRAIFDGILNGVEKKLPEFQKRFPSITKASVKKMRGAGLFWQDAEWSLTPAFSWALSQCEEYFCDFIGLRLFEEAFLCSFGYLLAPGFKDTRSNNYPEMESRIKALLKASAAYEIEAPKGFDVQFDPGGQPEIEEEKLLLQLSDSVSSEMVPTLIERAQKAATDRKLCEVSREDIEAIKNSFFNLVPPTNPASLANILIAGWKIANEGEGFWPDHARVRERNEVVLNELILKSVEVLEIKCRLESA